MSPQGPGGSGCLLTQHPCSRRVSGLWPLGPLPPALFTPCPFLSRVLHYSPAFSSPASSHPLVRSYLLSSLSVIRQCRRCHSHGREQDRAHALLGCPFKPERERETHSKQMHIQQTYPGYLVVLRRERKRKRVGRGAKGRLVTQAAVLSQRRVRLPRDVLRRLERLSTATTLKVLLVAGGERPGRLGILQSTGKPQRARNDLAQRVTSPDLETPLRRTGPRSDSKDTGAAAVTGGGPSKEESAPRPEIRPSVGRPGPRSSDGQRRSKVKPKRDPECPSPSSAAKASPYKGSSRGSQTPFVFLTLPRFSF